MLIGFADRAGCAYIRTTDCPARSPSSSGRSTAFVYNKWYFDELYDLLFVRPAFWFGRLFWQSGDEGIIDRFGPERRRRAVEKGAVARRAAPVGLPLPTTR